MSKLDFEYAKGRFLNSSKVVDAAIYTKQATTADADGQYPVVIRVAISMDTEHKDKAVLYSDVMTDDKAARAFIASVPSNN